MIKQQSAISIKKAGRAGFTLIELLITMTIFVLAIAAASQIFTGLLTQFKQQSKIAETNIEGVVGLDILRRDIEHVGYGLPWDLNSAIYEEADNDAATAHNDTLFNDSTSNPPRAIISGNGVGINNSDVLVIKAVNVAINAASSKWTHLFTGNTVTEWEPDTERLVTSDRVIVLRPGDTRTLVVSGGSFTTRYRADTDPDSLFDASFAPSDNTETRVVYGVTPPASPVTTWLRMPFNRADYYVRTPGTMPTRCATGTGILYKATVNQGTGATAGGGLTELPLLDCAADMQVIFRLDTDGNGVIDTTTADISILSGVTATAQSVREQIKEVRVYILAHEGQYDRTYTFNNFTCGANCVRVGEFGLGWDFDLSVITNYPNYRWKIYTLVIKPNNLR